MAKKRVEFGQATIKESQNEKQIRSRQRKLDEDPEKSKRQTNQFKRLSRKKLRTEDHGKVKKRPTKMAKKAQTG